VIPRCSRGKSFLLAYIRPVTGGEAAAAALFYCPLSELD
jgi:hypothetical protein